MRCDGMPWNSQHISQNVLKTPETSPQTFYNALQHPASIPKRLQTSWTQVAEEQEREAARRAQEQEPAGQAAEAAREEFLRAQAALKVQSLARNTYRF